MLAVPYRASGSAPALPKSSRQCSVLEQKNSRNRCTRFQSSRASVPNGQGGEKSVQMCDSPKLLPRSPDSGDHASVEDGSLVTAPFVHRAHSYGHVIAAGRWTTRGENPSGIPPQRPEDQKLRSEVRQDHQCIPATALPGYLLRVSASIHTTHPNAIQNGPASPRTIV
jgi:hypothetical protein